jgi:chromosome segregation ATPase
MSRLAPAAWDDGAADENSLPFKNVAARQKQKKVGSRVDCGANAVSVRRKGLTENNSSGDSAQPVGRTTALPTTTVSNKDMEVPGLDDGCTDYHELATKVMPDRDEEWRMVLNTKVSAPKWETKKVVEQQVRLIGDLKKNIDVGRQQRAVFLERIKIVQRQLHTELSQLDNAQGACARADGLREQIAALETRLGSIEQETTEAVEKADAAEADLAEQRAALNSKEDELEENQTMLHEAKSAAASAQEDCVSELVGLKDKLEASVEAVAKLKASIADLETKIIKTEKDSSSALAAHEKELDAFGKKMAALDTECRELAAVATAAETEAKKLQSLQETNEATLASEQATLAECRTTMESLTAQEKDTQRLREEVVSLKKSQTSLTEETSSLHAQKDQLQTQNRQVANEMGDLQEKCDALSNEETKLTELNGRLETNIADNQGKTRQATAAAAEALQQYTEQSNAVAALSQQLSKDEAEQAAAEAEEAAQTAKHNELITEKENLTKLHDEFVAEKPVLLEKIKTGTVELEELRAKHGAAEKQQMAK